MSGHSPSDGCLREHQTCSLLTWLLLPYCCPRVVHQTPEGGDEQDGLPPLGSKREWKDSKCLRAGLNEAEKSS